MNVLLAGSDEASGRTHRDTFLFAGWIAPEEDWTQFFSPAWQERVLDGPPAIPYLHMTEIRSPAWREQYGISKLQADDRIDEAFTLIDAMQSLYPIGVSVDAGIHRDTFVSARVISPTVGPAAKLFAPDYLCFLYYAYLALNHVDNQHPECDKVDFMVERNGEITKHIQGFHSTLPKAIESLGKLDSKRLSRLVGDLIPGDKDRVPLQAADVLCWHTARYERPDTMDAADLRRYGVIATRKGARYRISPDEIAKLYAVMSPWGG